ncbi:ABC transporter permease [Rhodobacteraceae bacterium KMM 6894]|nr:ABC transporter permease [Rhodobacteraceae bacterium KMM 6894]
MSKSELDALRARKFRSARTIGALILREMTTTYGRTPGGYLWALLEPIGAVAMITLVLGTGLRLRSPSLGTSFVLFYATGMLTYLMYHRVQVKVAKSLTFSRPLLFYPGVTYVDTIIARFFLNGLTQCMAFGLVIAGILTIFDTRAVLDVPPILTAMAMSLSLALGIGSFNAFLMPRFPLWESVWSILTAPLFLISGIFYTYEDLPDLGQTILWYNPIIHAVAVMRRGFYPSYDATWASPLYVFALSMICLFLGIVFLGRYHRDIINQDF